MSLLHKQIIVKGIKGQRTINALFDSGASYTCIRRDIAEEISVLTPLEEPIEFETEDEGTMITAEYAVRFSFYFQDTNRRFTDEFMVLETLSEECIIGASSMQKWKIRLDFDREEVLYDKKMHKLRI